MQPTPAHGPVGAWPQQAQQPTQAAPTHQTVRGPDHTAFDAAYSEALKCSFHQLVNDLVAGGQPQKMREGGEGDEEGKEGKENAQSAPDGAVQAATEKFKARLDAVRQARDIAIENL